MPVRVIRVQFVENAARGSRKPCLARLGEKPVSPGRRARYSSANCASGNFPSAMAPACSTSTFLITSPMTTRGLKAPGCRQARDGRGWRGAALTR